MGVAIILPCYLTRATGNSGVTCDGPLIQQGKEPIFEQQIHIAPHWLFDLPKYLIGKDFAT